LRGEVEAAGADVIEEHGQRDGRVLGAVDRAGEDALAADELDRIEVEPLPRRREADDDARAAVPRPPEGDRRRLRVTDRVEGVVDAAGELGLHQLLQLVGPGYSRRAQPRGLLASRLE